MSAGQNKWKKYVSNLKLFLTINEQVKYVVQLAMKLFVMTFICRIIHRETMPNVQLKELVCRKELKRQSIEKK